MKKGHRQKSNALPAWPEWLSMSNHSSTWASMGPHLAALHARGLWLKLMEIDSEHERKPHIATAAAWTADHHDIDNAMGPTSPPSPSPSSSSALASCCGRGVAVGSGSGGGGGGGGGALRGSNGHADTDLKRIQSEFPLLSRQLLIKIPVLTLLEDGLQGVESPGVPRITYTSVRYRWYMVHRYRDGRVFACA